MLNRATPILCALLLFLAKPSCADYYITSPYSATVWYAGQTAMITWDLLPGVPVSQTQIDLMDGPDLGAQVLYPIASGLNPSSTSYAWAVPADIGNISTVFVRLTGISGGVPVVYRFSHRFAIQAGAPSSTVVPVTSVPQPPPTSTVAPTSAASMTKGAPTSQTSAASGSASRPTATIVVSGTGTAIVTVLRPLKSNEAASAALGSVSYGIVLVLISTILALL